MKQINIIDFFFESNAVALEITCQQLEEIAEKATDEELDKIINLGEATEEQKQIAKELVNKYCTEWIK